MKTLTIRNVPKRLAEALDRGLKLTQVLGIPSSRKLRQPVAARAMAVGAKAAAEQIEDGAVQRRVLAPSFAVERLGEALGHVSNRQRFHECTITISVHSLL